MEIDIEKPTAGGVWVSRLEQLVTLEIALYAVALLLGVAMRLLLLDARPLSVEEGNLAMEAFNLAMAQPVDAIQQGPLLAFGTALSLMLFGGGDAAARLLPVISGSALVAVPYLLRQSIGRTVALVAAYGIALSPLALFASRDLGAGMISLSLGGFLLAALIRGLKDANKAQAYGVAALLAGLVTSGTEGITVLLTLSIAAILAHPQPALLLSNLRSAAGSPLWRRAAIVFAAMVLILSTCMGTRLGGVQWVLGDVWVNWATSFSLSAPRGGLLALLALYEMPVLFLGIAQLIRTMFRRQHIDMLLSLWLMLLLLLGMVQQAHTVSRLILPTLPLYLLAARLICDISTVTRYAGHSWKWATACTIVAVPIAVAIVLLNRASTPGMEIPSPFLYGEAILVILAVATILFALQGKERLALGWYALAVLSVGFIVHTTVFLNYRMETIGQEPVVGTQITPSLRDAAKEAAYYSRYYSQTITVDPDIRNATRWYLREAPNVRYSLDVSDGISFELIRTGQTVLEPGSERRAGFLVPGIDSRNMSWRGLWRWLITRDGLVRANQRDIIVRSPSGNW